MKRDWISQNKSISLNTNFYIMRYIITVLLMTYSCAYGQNILVENAGEREKIQTACILLKEQIPDIFEAITQHCYIQRVSMPETDYHSTISFDSSSRAMWILIGTASLTQRSVQHVAGTIYHESLHLLNNLDRERKGDIIAFSGLSANRRREEEVNIYRLTYQLLKKLNAPAWEIREYADWVKGAETRDYK